MTRTPSPRSRRLGVLLAGLALVGSTFAVPTAAHAAPPVSGYTLSFSDEFNGTAVDTSKWNYRTDQKAKSAQLPANVQVYNGFMRIALKKQTVGSYQYTGGGLVTKQRFGYGYYETRAKITAKSGWHSSFWAQIGNGSNTYNPDRQTEIDAFEIDSSNPSRVSTGVISWFGTEAPNARKFTNISPSSAEFHVYGFEWTPTQVKIYIDGALIHTINHTSANSGHDPVNVWLTSIAYETVDESGLPGQAAFDYFRYYKKS